MSGLFEELDDMVRIAEANLNLIKDMAGTLLEYSEAQDRTMGRVGGIARNVAATPIVAAPVPPPPPIEQPSVAEKLAEAKAKAEYAEKMAAAQKAAQKYATPVPPPPANGALKEKSWSEVLQEVTTRDLPTGAAKRAVTG